MGTKVHVFIVGALALVACRGKLHSPDKIAAEMLPVLVDLEAVDKAERCEGLLKRSEEFEAGKPYVVVPTFGESCKVVSKSKPDRSVHGDFVLPSHEACDELQESAQRHENNLRAKIKLACGADGKPTTEPDASVQLAARISLRERLAATVKAANSGSISAEISNCYFGVKQEMLKIASGIRQSRCTAIKDAEQVKGVTFDALWTHARLHPDLMEYQKTHGEAWEKATKEKKHKELFEQFDEEAKNNACSPKTERDLAAQRLAAKTAAETCM